MAADLDPVKPVHPGWPSRPVPEEGDERRRYRPEVPPRDEAEDGEPGEGEPTPDNRRPPPDDSTGRHVDEYV
ncbi:hypothetical protein B1C78_05260 [Thioalkalivibrio denitrificans]|uniref:Uncharacterized protein n=1 Tax=Thioalkalivibrio denitrificans TaxID=108003 RepID=A0A1V3NMM9_9GAMM|nr:hypothetical protein [Thioalkalivibrio denitrificans]OOG26213.1 hypothetical protein B1C78_05260 [Thioalkalivibrio denitrificans]